MTEEWRPTHHPFYEVSDQGRVRSYMRVGSRRRNRTKITEPRILRSHPDRGGYWRVVLEGTTYSLHRLVAAAFLGPCPEGQECLHLDDDKANNALWNICYGTHLENVQQCVKRGRRVYRSGEENGYSKLSAAQVATARELRQWMSLREIGTSFNVHLTTIWKATADVSWRHV